MTRTAVTDGTRVLSAVAGIDSDHYVTATLGRGMGGTHDLR